MLFQRQQGWVHYHFVSLLGHELRGEFIQRVNVNPRIGLSSCVNDDRFHRGEYLDIQSTLPH